MAQYNNLRKKSTKIFSNHLSSSSANGYASLLTYEVIFIMMMNKVVYFQVPERANHSATKRAMQSSLLRSFKRALPRSPLLHLWSASDLRAFIGGLGVQSAWDIVSTVIMPQPGLGSGGLQRSETHFNTQTHHTGGVAGDRRSAGAHRSGSVKAEPLPTVTTQIQPIG